VYNYALNANGRVLINYSKELRDDLTNPALSVVNSSSNPALLVTNSTNGVNQSAGIYFGQMTTSAGFQARSGGSIRSIATGTYTAGNAATYVADLAFYTGNNGDNQKLILIGSTGYLGVNTATVGSQLQVNGNVAIGYSASTAAPSNGLAVSGTTLIGTTTDSGQGVLQVSGGITGAGISLSGEVNSATATLSKAYYHVFTGSTGQTLTLPSPSSNNYQYVIINNTANSVTIAAATSTNIITTTNTSVASITLIANARTFILADGNNKYYQVY